MEFKIIKESTVKNDKIYTPNFIAIIIPKSTAWPFIYKTRSTGLGSNLSEDFLRFNNFHKMTLLARLVARNFTRELQWTS